MEKLTDKLLPAGFVLFLTAFVWYFPAIEALSAPPLYWCPKKAPDQQYALNPAPGCTPFVDKEEEQSKAQRREEKGKAPPNIKLEGIESETAKFLKEYRQFVDCCASDLDELDQLQDLQDRASDLLKAFQETNIFHQGSWYSSRTFRQFTIGEMIRSVAQAHDDLKKLRARLQQIGNSLDKLDGLDYEAAGRERRRTEQEVESIPKDFKPTLPPEYPRTGVEVQDTTLPNRIGTQSSDTTLIPARGEDIADVASPSSKTQPNLRPRVGMDAVDSTLPTRPGPTSQDTTLPYSFGSESETAEGQIGPSTTRSRVGPAIGDSSLNRRP